MESKATCEDVITASDEWHCQGCRKMTRRKVHVIKHVDWPDKMYNDCPGWYICSDECAAIIAERRMAIIRKAREKGAAHDTTGSEHHPAGNSESGVQN